MSESKSDALDRLATSQYGADNETRTRKELTEGF